MRRFLLFILILGLHVPALAQIRAPFVREHSSRELRKAVPQTIYQDQLGWIWTGCRDGLYRYDGQNFEAQTLPDTCTSQSVTAIAQLGDTLWIGLANGQICFKPYVYSQPEKKLGTNLKQFTLWSPEEGLPTEKITGFLQDRDGNIWIGTYGEGLYCHHQGVLFQFGKEEQELNSNDVYDLTMDKRGRVWAATDAGIAICSIKNKQKQVQFLGKDQGLSDEIVTVLETDSFDNIWIGTYDQGLFRYQQKSGLLTHMTPDWNNGSLSGINPFGKQEVWLATAKKGIFIYNQVSKRFEAISNQSLNQAISATIKDREGMLWVSNPALGLQSIQARFSYLPTQAEEIQALIYTDNNQLWIGGRNGLHRLDLSSGSQSENLLETGATISSLHKDPSGFIWAGSFGQGLYLLDSSGKLIKKFTQQNGLANNSILSIASEGKNIWIATLAGVFKGNADSGFSNTDLPAEFGKHYVYKIFVDSKKRIWLCTDGDGLISFFNGRVNPITQLNGKNLQTVFDIKEDADGTLWLITPDHGLFAMGASGDKNYTTEELLQTDHLLNLQIAASGNIYLGYEEGLDILTPSTGHVAHYTDGKTNFKELGFNLNASASRGGNQLLFGTSAGLLCIKEFDEQFVFDPQPNITEILLFMEPISDYNQSEFAHDENYLLFRFTGLWFTNPEAVKYRYRLDGYDLDWKVTKDQLASYSNLPPGTYTFRFQTSEHGSFEGTPAASYHFVVASPIYARWWFILLSIALILFLLRLWIRNREDQLKQKAMLKKQNADSRFSALKSQINPHFLFNSFNTLITTIEESPENAVAYVEHLSDYYRTMMAYREKDVIPLQEEIALVRNYYFLLKKRFEENLHLEVRGQFNTGFIIPLSLQILVENAVKHNVISHAHPLKIEIYNEAPNYIVVRNNIQPKLKQETGTNFGLQSLIDRYKLLGDHVLKVEKTEEYFTVHLPIIEAP
jgi:ligand-binding sensor domain-containing protein